MKEYKRQTSEARERIQAHLYFTFYNADEDILCKSVRSVRIFIKQYRKITIQNLDVF